MARKKTWFDARAAKELARQVGMKTLHEGAEAILTESIQQTPFDTGTLRRSGTVTDAPKENAVYISYNTPYAVHVHEGYGPHVIRARDAKVLAVPANRWKGGPVNPYGSDALPAYSKDGRYVILGKQVNHPGFAGVKYLENPFNRLKDKVMKLARLKIKKALKDAK
jgi:hypothetical protein